MVRELIIGAGSSTIVIAFNVVEQFSASTTVAEYEPAQSSKNGRSLTSSSI